LREIRTAPIFVKITLKFSILLNLLLVGALCFILVTHRKGQNLSIPSAKVTPALAATDATAQAQHASGLESFRWSQLNPGNDYRRYLANLRAIGCPENTIEDIVRGNVGRAFAWERSQLKIDSSATGPWSPEKEQALVGNLLGEPFATKIATAGQSTGNPAQLGSNATIAETQPAGGQSVASAGPLFLQNVNWTALGFNASQQAAISQAKQQYLDEVNAADQNSPGSGQSDNSSSSNPNNPSSSQQSQKAAQDANNTLEALLGSQAYNAYVQAQYNQWFEAQVRANAGSGNLAISPTAFSPQ
jgi:hypothetical protein